MPFEVFISHSLKDKATAQAVCAKLEGARVRCWIAPRDIRPGADWAESIIAALGTCKVMVLIFSAHADASPQVRREVQRAFERGLTVVPFRIEDVNPSASLEYYIGSVHWLDALTHPMEDHIDQLVSLVTAITDAATQPEELAPAYATVPNPEPTTPTEHCAETLAVPKLLQADEEEPKAVPDPFSDASGAGIGENAANKQKKGLLIAALAVLVAVGGFAEWWWLQQELTDAKTQADEAERQKHEADAKMQAPFFIGR
jgi:hypothetical protein